MSGLFCSSCNFWLIVIGIPNIFAFYSNYFTFTPSKILDPQPKRPRRLSSVTSHNAWFTSAKALNLFVKIISASSPPQRRPTEIISSRLYHMHTLCNTKDILRVCNRLEWTNGLERRALCCGEMSGERNFSRASVCWLLITEYPLAAHASYQLDKTWTPTFLTAFCSMVNSTDNTTNGAITLRLFIAFREYTKRNVKNYIIIIN